MRARYVLLLTAAATVLYVGLSHLPLWPRARQPLVSLRTLESEEATEPERSADEMRLLADVLFRRLDANGDGQLDGEELPPALRDHLKRWDRNGDGHIDADEFRHYFQARLDAFTEMARRDESSRSATSSRHSRSNTEEPFAPEPAWIANLDTDRTDRVSLSEWRAAGLSAEEFARLDRNGDGFLTATEVLAARDSVALAPSFLATAAGLQRDKPAPAETRSESVPNNPSAVLQSQWSSAAKEGVFLMNVAQKRKASASRNRSATATRARPSVARASSRAAAPPAGSAAPTGNADWAARNAEIAAEAALGHTNVVFLGDSITDWLANGAGWPVWDLCFAPLGAEDFAVAGYTTSQVMAQVQVGDVSAVSPRVVVLMIGTNDLYLGSSPAEVSAATGGIVSTLTKQLPQTRILLLGILPRGPDATDPLRPLIAETNAGLARLADGSRVRYLDFGTDFLLPDGSLSPAIMADYLHPTLLGYQFYASALLGRLQGLLDAGPLPTARDRLAPQ